MCNDINLAKYEQKVGTKYQLTNKLSQRLYSKRQWNGIIQNSVLSFYTQITHAAFTHVAEEQQKIGREGIDREKIQPGGKFSQYNTQYNVYIYVSYEYMYPGVALALTDLYTCMCTYAKP